MKRVHIIVSGVVQGVGFRYYTHKEANALGLTGFVRNNPDGSVEIESQGTPEHIERFLQWAKKGPPSASVESFQKNEMDVAKGEMDFTIR